MNESQRNTRRMNSGYTNAQLKCPRTERNFPYDTGLHNLYHSQPRRDDIFSLILRHIGDLSLDDVDQFLPLDDNRKRNVTNFVSHIECWAQIRLVQRDVYARHIENLQNSAAMDNASPAPAAPIAPPTRRRTVNRVPVRLRNYIGDPVIDVQSISSDSSGSVNIDVWIECV